MEWEFIFQLLLAVILGIIVGFEREYRQKAAGLRTHAFICLGATLFTIISYEGFRQFIGITDFDPARVAAQIITGIGFIGAGVIMHRKGRIEGVTTASGLWMAAAIGITVGCKLYLLALTSAFLVILLFVILRKVEFWLNKKTQKRKESLKKTA